MFRSEAGPKAKGGDTTAQQSRRRSLQKLDKGEWWRELTAAGAKVQCITIQKNADAAEKSMLESLRPIFDKMAKDATRRLEPLLNSQGVKALDGSP